MSNFQGDLSNADARGSKSGTIHRIKAKMLSKYDTSINYCFSQAINNLIVPHEGEGQNIKQAVHKIAFEDIKFNDEVEYMERIYENIDYESEIKELGEYYKYYCTEPIVFFSSHFKIMSKHYQRKKADLYQKLKHILSISSTPTGHGNNETENMKKQENLSNLLAELHNISKNYNEQSQDQSECFVKLRDKFIRYYGPPNSISMNKVDSIYNFHKSGPTSFRAKPNFYHKSMKASLHGSNTQKDNENKFRKILESTNISNSNTFVHVNTAKNVPPNYPNYREDLPRSHFSALQKISMKRFRSCISGADLSPYSGPYSGKTSEAKRNKKIETTKAYNWRRRSAEDVQLSHDKSKREPLDATQSQAMKRKKKIQKTYNIKQVSNEKEKEKEKEKYKIEGKKSKLALCRSSGTSQQKSEIRLNSRQNFRRIQTRTLQNEDIANTLAKVKKQLKVDKKLNFKENCQIGVKSPKYNNFVNNDSRCGVNRKNSAAHKGKH